MTTNRRGRRNAVPCVLCSVPTHDSDAVCMSCRTRHKLAQRQNKMIEDGIQANELIGVSIPRTLYLWASTYRGDLPTNAHDDVKTLRHALIALCAFLPASYAPDASMIGRLPGQGSDAEKDWFYASPEKASLFAEILAITHKLIAIGYRDGHKDGSNLLLKLANDELSVEQLNKAERKVQTP